MGRKKKYQTEEERIAAKIESIRKFKESNPDYYKQWYAENSEKRKESKKKWRENNPDKVKGSKRKYHSTPMGRANYLVNNYRREDKIHNRGKCTLTPQWIVDNIFSGQICFYCKESDWYKLGCDRIDNSLPHTPENVVCCCEECNKKRGTKDFEVFFNQ